MICSFCSKVALYRVGGRGYCTDHRPRALLAAKEQVAERSRRDGLSEFFFLKQTGPIGKSSLSRKRRLEMRGKDGSKTLGTQSSEYTRTKTIKPKEE